jgi:hypothetical protein
MVKILSIFVAFLENINFNFMNQTNFVKSSKSKKIVVSEVGFEPTPSFEDQNAHLIEAKSCSLESGALDRSAILAFLLIT